ncbi:transcription/translation regulatory transformer protein RfaH [Pseudomonas sp. 14P_8.1_Bac3]|uniref:transcription/translation regulatory transformer protein RfaH n=1 Tax=Pseudomonas sp. 14P_8.1_Bac3 TaxID=2971621 RepID=UPI0039659911
MHVKRSDNDLHLPAHEKSAWYLVQCKARQDERAEENLIRQGYECARPVCRRERIVRGKRTTSLESLFPGYLFIYLPNSTNWAPLRSTRGVNCVVSFGGKPLAVNQEIVTRLQNRIENIKPAFVAGTRVRILEGGLGALDAIFLSADGEERVILLINLLHRQQTVSMPLMSVSAF